MTMATETIVRAVQPNGTALVEYTSGSSCGGDCGSCSGCKERRSVTVRDPLGVREGQRVIIAPGKGALALAVILLYILPVAALIAGYLTGEYLWGQGILAGLGGVVLWLVLANIINRLVLRKRPGLYRIIGIKTDA